MSVALKDVLDALLSKHRAEIDRRFKQHIDEIEFPKRQTLVQWLARREQRNTADDVGDHG